MKRRVAKLTCRAQALALLLCLAVPVSAARLRVAVLPFTSTHRAPMLATQQASQGLTNAVAFFLSDTKRFEVLSADLFGGKLSRDVLRNQSPAAIQQVATDLKLDYAVTGNLDGDATTTEATASFVRLGADRYGSSDANVRAVGYTDGNVGYLADQLARKAAQLFPIKGRVLLALTGRQFLVNLTASDGLTVGATLQVHELHETRDPDTGEVLETKAILVGEAKVSGLNEKTAECQMTGPGTPTKGMVVTVDTPEAAEEAPLSFFRIFVGDAVGPKLAAPDPMIEGLGEILEGSLATPGPNISVLYRPHEKLDENKVQAEIQLGQRADFDWRTTVKAGQQWGANVLVMPVVAKQGKDYRVQARLARLDTSAVMVTAYFHGNDILSLCDPLAADITRVLRNLAPDQIKVGTLDAQLNCPFTDGSVPVGQYPCLAGLGTELVSWTLENSGEEPCRVRMSVDLSGYSVAPYTTEVTLRPHQRLKSVGQNPRMDPSKVSALPQDATPAQVQCALEVLGDTGPKKVLERSYPVQLLRPGIWMSPLKGLDAMPTLAMLAQDSDALVALRGQAAQLTRAKSKTLPGYQSNALGLGDTGASPEERAALVREQVEAVYDAVAQRKVKYVEQSAVAFPPTEAQRVLTPDQVLKGGAANCLDSSILFCALLAPVVQPILIVTDDHAFIGWHVWNTPEAPYEVLETTHVGIASFDEAVAAGRQKAGPTGLSILDILRGQQGRVDFDSHGMLCAPRDVTALPGVQAIIDVRTAQRFFQTRR